MNLAVGAMQVARDIAMRGASLIRRHLLVLLIVAYLCSTFLPQPGLWLRAPFSMASNVGLIQLMLACLLFTLGLSVSWSRIGELIRECKWVGVTLVARLMISAGLIFLMQFLPVHFTGILVGFVLIMAAPTAVSSSGWSLQLGCSESVTVAVILGTTFASMISAPLVLGLGAWLGPSAARESLTQLQQVFDARFVLPWVVIPTLLGITVRSVFPRSAESLRGLGHGISPILLLLLNYSNASSSLPQLQESLSLLATGVTIVGCIVLFVTVSGVARWLANRLQADSSQCMSTVLGAGMGNTGLVLLVATLAMPQEIEIHLAIIVYTFVQHIAAAVMARRFRCWSRKTSDRRGMG